MSFPRTLVFGAGWIGRQLVQQNGEGPAVADDVVKHRDQGVVLIGDA